MGGEGAISSELLVDQVYRDIRRRIINGELPPGSRLGTRVLCEYYRISDTPLKQALNRLLTEGLVESLPRRGMRVHRLGQKDIHEAIEARIMIELYAVPHAIACVQKSGELLEKLEANIAEDERLIEQAGDFCSYSDTAEQELEVSQSFHDILVASVGNGAILKAYRNIVNHRYVYYQFNRNKRTQVRASLEEHRAILQCLRECDEQGMRQAILRHLQAREYDVSTVYQPSRQPVT